MSDFSDENPGTEKDEPRVWVHVHMGGGHFSPCGKKVSSHDSNDEIAPSCGDDFTKVTCPLCMALIARMVKSYRVATRGRKKWSEVVWANQGWDKTKMVKRKLNA